MTIALIVTHYNLLQEVDSDYLRSSFEPAPSALLIKNANKDLIFFSQKYEISKPGNLPLVNIAQQNESDFFYVESLNLLLLIRCTVHVYSLTRTSLVCYRVCKINKTT